MLNSDLHAQAAEEPVYALAQFVDRVKLDISDIAQVF